MRGLRNSSKVAAAALCGLSILPVAAQADIVLHDADGWRFYTRGRVEAHYQLIQGDGDPISNNLVVGGEIQNSVSQDENNKLVDSRIRSGFVGSQIGFGVDNKFSESVVAKAFLAVWLNGIDSNKGVPPDVKGVDFREAWGSLESPYGTFLFGRAFSIFGSASGEVNRYAFEYAVGHPCVADQSAIACGSTGAGPLYAGFNAQLRYLSPRVAGFGAQVSLEDPSSLPDYHITPLPRFEGEVSYQAEFLGDGKFVVQGQGLGQQLGKINATHDGTVTVTAWGIMGAARLEIGGFKLGGGAWTGKGLGTNTALQQDQQSNPLAHDKPGGNFPGDELRSFRGFFGNVVYDYHGTALALGGGAANVQETDADAASASHISLLRQNVEYHAVFTQRIHSIVLSAEFMHWNSSWYLGETQAFNFVGSGATFVW